MSCSDSASSEASDFGQQQWRLIAQEYPFVGNDGELVCAVHERTVDGARQKTTEFYHLDVISERLSKKPELARKLSEEGIEEVASCEDARHFMEVQLELAEAEPTRVDSWVVDEPSADPVLPAAAPIEPTTEAPTIEKIIDGQSFAGAITVYIQLFNEPGYTCSGVLIGARELITSAHCFAASGLRQATVRIHNGDCISHSDCAVAPTGSARPDISRAPYGGKSDVGDDVAVWVNPTDWDSPADSSTWWSRVAVTNPGVANRFWMIGYGFHDNAGSGLGQQQLSTSTVRIDWSGSRHFYADRGSGDSGLCQGDSGGPSTNTSIIGKDILFGPASTGQTGGGLCTTSNGRMRWPHIGDHWTLIENAIGRSCNQYSNNNNNFTYRRCW